MEPAEKKDFKAKIDQIAKKQLEKKEMDDDINDLVATAAEKFGVSKKLVKSLAKETRMSDVERSEQKLFEGEMHHYREQLGILADLPLGEAALAKEANKKNGKSTTKTPAMADAH